MGNKFLIVPWEYRGRTNLTYNFTVQEMEKVTQSVDMFG